MLEIVGLKEEQMAKVYESYQSVGYVKKTISDMTGLSTSTRLWLELETMQRRQLELVLSGREI